MRGVLSEGTRGEKTGQAMSEKRGGFWHKESLALRVLGRCARGSAVLSALFVVGVAVLTVAGWLQMRSNDPLDDVRMSVLREELKANPSQEALRQEIRTLDLLGRRVYFSNMEHIRRGIQLMVFSLVVLVLSGGISAEVDRRLPVVSGAAREDSWRSMAAAWRGVVWLAILIGVGGIAAGLLLERTVVSDFEPLPDQPAPAVADDDGAGNLAPEPEVTSEEIKKNWPGFLGPFGRSAGYVKSVPTSWDYAEGDGMLWSLDLDKYGYSSPIVWEGKIFVSQADSNERELICVNSADGAVIWKKTIGPYPDSPAETPEVFCDEMYAAPTPLTDGSRIYVMFGNGDIACFDVSGNELWGKNLGVPVIDYGYSSSPIMCEGQLIVQMEGKGDVSTMLALNPLTGDRLWSANRPASSWSTPVIYEAPDGKKQLLCVSISALSGHSVEDGRQLWVVEGCLSGELGSSAAWSGDMVYISSVGEGVKAYRLGAEAPELIWQWDESPAEMATPLIVDDLLFIASASGNVACLDAATGTLKWSMEGESEFYASPVHVAGNIYALSRDGVMHVLGAGAELKVIGEYKSGEKTDATPAFIENKIIIRTADELICYGE